jgi:hypothetical protein
MGSSSGLPAQQCASTLLRTLRRYLMLFNVCFSLVFMLHSAAELKKEKASQVSAKRDSSDGGSTFSLLQRMTTLTNSASKCSMLMQELASEGCTANDTAHSSTIVSRASGSSSSKRSGISGGRQRHSASSNGTIGNLQPSTVAFATTSDIVSAIHCIKSCTELLRDSSCPPMDMPFDAVQETQTEEATKKSAPAAVSMSVKERTEVAIVQASFAYCLSRVIALCDHSKLEKCARGGGSAPSSPAPFAASSRGDTESTSPTVSSIILQHMICSIVVGSVTGLVALAQCLADKDVSMPDVEGQEQEEPIIGEPTSPAPRKKRVSRGTTKTGASKSSGADTAVPSLSTTPDNDNALIHLALWQLLSSLEGVVALGSTAKGGGLSLSRGSLSISVSQQHQPWWETATKSAAAASSSHTEGNRVNIQIRSGGCRLGSRGSAISSPSLTSTQQFSSLKWIQQYLLPQLSTASGLSSKAKGVASPNSLVSGTKEAFMNAARSLLALDSTYGDHRGAEFLSKLGPGSDGSEGKPEQSAGAGNYKQWGNIVLMQSCGGFNTLLTVVARMLDKDSAENNNRWVCVFEAVSSKTGVEKPDDSSGVLPPPQEKKSCRGKSSSDANISVSIESSSATRRSKRKKKKTISNVQETDDTGGVSPVVSISNEVQRLPGGNVLVLVYASKLLDLLADVGSTGSQKTSFPAGLKSVASWYLCGTHIDSTTAEKKRYFPFIELFNSSMMENKNATLVANTTSPSSISRRSKRKTTKSALRRSRSSDRNTKASPPSTDDGSFTRKMEEQSAANHDQEVVGLCSAVMTRLVSFHAAALQQNCATVRGLSSSSSVPSRIIFTPEDVAPVSEPSPSVYSTELCQYFPCILPTMSQLAKLASLGQSNTSISNNNSSTSAGGRQSSWPSEMEYLEPNRDFAARALSLEIVTGAPRDGSGAGSAGLSSSLSKVQTDWYARFMVYGAALGLRYCQTPTRAEPEIMDENDELNHYYDGKLLLFSLSTFRMALQALDKKRTTKSTASSTTTLTLVVGSAIQTTTPGKSTIKVGKDSSLDIIAYFLHTVAAREVELRKGAGILQQLVEQKCNIDGIGVDTGSCSSSDTLALLLVSIVSSSYKDVAQYRWQTTTYRMECDESTSKKKPFARDGSSSPSSVSAMQRKYDGLLHTSRVALQTFRLMIESASWTDAGGAIKGVVSLFSFDKMVVLKDWFSGVDQYCGIFGPVVENANEVKALDGSVTENDRNKIIQTPVKDYLLAERMLW